MRETESERTEAKIRNLLWLELLWEGNATTAREEEQKEIVLAVFQRLASESRIQGTVHDYVPWQPLW